MQILIALIPFAVLLIVLGFVAWPSPKCPRCNSRRTTPCRDPQKQFCLDCMNPFVVGERRDR